MVSKKWLLLCVVMSFVSIFVLVTGTTTDAAPTSQRSAIDREPGDTAPADPPLAPQAMSTSPTPSPENGDLGDQHPPVTPGPTYTPANDKTVYPKPTDLPPTPVPTLSAEARRVVDFVSQQTGIASESLYIAGAWTIDYPLSERRFHDYTVLDISSSEGHEFQVQIDLDSGDIAENTGAAKAAEKALRAAKYGKLDPALYDRLAIAPEGEPLTVAVWVAHDGKARSREQVYQALRERYPAASQAMDRVGVPWAVTDKALSDAIRAAYRQMREEDTAARIAPLLAHLQSKGREPRTYGSMPALSTDLTPAEIERLAKRNDVETIYLAGAVAETEMDVAFGSNRGFQVWEGGATGGSVRIAILEPGKIDPTVTGLDIVATRTAAAVSDHKTEVASIAASSRSIFPGMAPNADIIDSGASNTQSDLIDALEWSLDSPQSAPIVNASFGVDAYTHTVASFDRAFDYWAREENALIVKSAGNDADYITSPGKGWNVLTVGGYDDGGTTVWTDDEWASFSSFRNPEGVDREKPELVAPAVNISTTSLSNVIVEGSGTSYAAPQVSGIAALLIDHQPLLATVPETVRAILMATAVNNISGTTVISTTNGDQYDGAGGVDAALAFHVADTHWTSDANGCPTSGFAVITTTSSSPSLGGRVHRYIKANRGERVRVAISWWARATSNYNYDDLDTNYNLYVYDPDENFVPEAQSISQENNYELSDFIAPKSGTYKIRIYRSGTGDNAEASNRVGLAWVRDATYIPYFASSDSGYDSEIIIRNDGSQSVSGVVTYYDTDGNYEDEETFTIASNARQHLDPALSSFAGSALVSGGEDLSVVVEQMHSSHKSAATGVRPPSSAEMNWETYADELQVSHAYCNYYGYTSTLNILNPNPESISVDVVYRNTSGTQVGSTSTYNLDAMENASDTPPWQSSPGFYGTAEVSSDDPVLVVSDARHSDGDIEFNAHGEATAQHNYLPYLAHDLGDWSSCFSVYNPQSAGSQTLYIYYYWDGGSYSTTSSVGGGSMTTFCQSTNTSLPDDKVLSARIFTIAPVAITANLSDNTNGHAMSYSGFGHGALSVVLPRLYDDWGNWTSTIVVQNAATSVTSTVPYISYYDSGGSLVDGPTSLGSLDRGEAATIDLSTVAPDSSFTGSAIITATCPIVAVVATSDSSASGDEYYMYNGVNR